MQALFSNLCKIETLSSIFFYSQHCKVCLKGTLKSFTLTVEAPILLVKSLLLCLLQYAKDFLLNVRELIATNFFKVPKRCLWVKHADED